MKNICKILIAFILVAGIITPSLALADKKEEKSKLEALTPPASTTESYYSSKEYKELEKSEDYIDNSDDREVIEKEIKKTEGEIKKVQKQINVLKQKQKALQDKYDRTYQAFQESMKYLYMSGDKTAFEAILEADGIVDYFNKMEMTKQTSKDAKESMIALQNAKKELEKNEKELSKSMESLKKKNEILKEGREALKALDTMSTGDGVLLSSEDIIEMANAGERIDENTGKLSYPTNYRKQSAGFPNYSSGRFHGGIDFPCPKGTPVQAAADGVVVLSRELNYSYGHYLLIDHGHGLSTLYAHNTTLLVKAGDKVKRGQIIAMSGTTGNSTGPHCHFEVRVNNKRVNPNDFLVTDNKTETIDKNEKEGKK